MSTVLDYCKELPEARFEADAVLMREGGQESKLYILIEGEVAVLKGNILVNTQSEPGTIFGELSVLLDVPHTATVKAVQPTRAYVVDNAQRFLQSTPEMAFHLSRLLAKKLNSITGYLVDLKKQFEDQEDHLGMVDEVLESLLNQQVEAHTPGSQRYPDSSL
jgi:CRP-like cAMP-binding protein